jgi:hypothetical protein
MPGTANSQAAGARIKPPGTGRERPAGGERRAISEELEDAPTTLSRDTRKAIEHEIVARTNRLLDALSLQEMQSVGAQIRHLRTIRAEVQHRIRHRRP